MISHTTINADHLRKKIRDHEICLGGNRRLLIYGKLNCRSGKKIKKDNRVFFECEVEAIEYGYRPCGRCLQEQYKKWKDAQKVPIRG